MRQLTADDYSDIVFKNNDTVISNKIYTGKNCLFQGSSNIQLGKNIIFGDGTKLAAISSFSSSYAKQQFNPILRIGNNVQVTASLQVYAMKEIIIEDNVLFAANVFISDGFHGYNRIDIPYKDQAMFNLEPVVIGEGCWIGQNVVIMPGVTIGKFTIIGANSVVNKEIAEYSIAVGNPARVIKKWNFKTSNWQQEKPDL
jgi:hypothetical protein